MLDPRPPLPPPPPRLVGTCTSVRTDEELLSLFLLTPPRPPRQFLPPRLLELLPPGVVPRSSPSVSAVLPSGAFPLCPTLGVRALLPPRVVAEAALPLPLEEALLPLRVA